MDETENQLPLPDDFLIKLVASQGNLDLLLMWHRRMVFLAEDDSHDNQIIVNVMEAEILRRMVPPFARQPDSKLRPVTWKHGTEAGRIIPGSETISEGGPVAVPKRHHAYGEAALYNDLFNTGCLFRGRRIFLSELRGDRMEDQHRASKLFSKAMLEGGATAFLKPGESVLVDQVPPLKKSIGKVYPENPYPDIEVH